MIALPDYFVRKVSGYPAGMKMPKMTRYHQVLGYSYQTNLPPFKFTGGVIQGDPLSGGDYRYWCGMPGVFAANKGYASCRCCGEVHCSKEGRKEHKKKGCGPKLEEAFKMLKRSTECIICKLATHRKVYGVPMCCKDCEFEWEFTTATPAVLRYVLEEIN